ncbi:MAG: SCP2 sterol-binding domain-containing protein [Bacillota bacterium]
MSGEAMILGSKEWFETAKAKLTASAELVKASADWEGCLKCVIDAEDEEAVKDFANEEGIRAILGMLSMLSVEERAKMKGTGLGGLTEKLGVPIDSEIDSVDVNSLIDKVSKLTVNDFKGVVIYAAFEPYHGTIKKMDPITPDAEQNAKFTITGKYKNWKKLCSGKNSIIQLVMTGRMKLSGDLKYLMKRMAAVNALMNVYKSIPIK